MHETIEMPWQKSLLGYELVGPSESDIQVLQSDEEGRALLEAMLADRLGGYHPASKIVPLGDKTTEYLVSSQLSQSDANIVEVFANTPVELVLGFANRFGPLQQHDWSGQGQDEWLARNRWLEPDLLAYWLLRQRWIRGILEQAMRGEYEEIEKSFLQSSIGQSHIKLLRSSRQARPQLIIEPSSLLQYIVIKLAVYIAGGALVRTCRECANIMIIGGETKGYLNREICSHRCRMIAYRRTQKAKKASRPLVS